MSLWGPYRPFGVHKGPYNGSKYGPWAVDIRVHKGHIGPYRLIFFGFANKPIMYSRQVISLFQILVFLTKNISPPKKILKKNIYIYKDNFFQHLTCSPKYICQQKIFSTQRVFFTIKNLHCDKSRKENCDKTL